ncbi:hypothetical protein ACE2AJ_09880 [Aquihabitans daechungensis]|uniref:hypothetical protein n=1 Tax=Aquihabitans daechungensis TaxID=1052257 RepID=UPI003B9FB4FA
MSSNPVACERVLADPGAYALTNIIAARAYGVAVLQDVCVGKRMPCVVFKAASDDSRTLDLRPWLGLGQPTPVADPS